MRKMFSDPSTLSVDCVGNFVFDLSRFDKNIQEVRISDRDWCFKSVEERLNLTQGRCFLKKLDALGNFFILLSSISVLDML